VTRLIPGPDTKPWFRQFWPWFLIALPASVVVAAVCTAVVASRHADDLVVDDYYKDGLAINRQLEKKQHAAELGISAQLQFSGDTVTAAMSGPVDQPSLRLLLSHPLEADRDFEMSLARVSQGVYRGTLAQTIAPRWHWTLQAAQDNGWRLDGVLQASDLGHAPGG
jgi:hypothetical protein